MRKTEYTILRKQIQKGSLVSPNSQNWYNSEGGLTPWSGSDYYIGPNIGDGIYNFTASVDGLYSSSVAQGYYKWNGTSWVTSSITAITDNYNLPIFLECSADEMGTMTSFDGDIEQVEQLSNFSYTQTGTTIQVYNTVNPDKLRVVLEQTFTINWGDGTTSGLTVNNGVVGSNLPSVSKTYSTNGQYEITISNSSPWSTEVLKKKVTIPRDISISDEFGYFTGYTLPGGTYQRYLYGYEYETGSIGITTGKTFTFMAIGKSRLGEFRNYGTSSFSTEIEPTPEYTGYTIDGLYYMDFPDGYTKITGSVPNYIHDLTGSTYTGYTYNSTGGTETFKFNKGSGSYFTTEYLDETDITNYIINHRLTRNEHFLGFIDDPQVYSDIFVERGKQGVMEKNLRLGEIDNMNELEIYGNGYFKIRKS